ncbi:MAG: MerC domain-containing protein [Nitrospirales bacterium]|nr:MerC domain-containing protein [Nitrospirales bacterium]
MSKLGIKLSKAGSITSLICAVHCALTPLAILALPVIAAHSWDGLDGILGGFMAKTTEWVFVGVIGVLAGFGLLATYPLHRDVRPTILTILGLAILTGSHLWVEAGGLTEIVLDISGASVIAVAGFWNRRLCHQLGCHTHEHSTMPTVSPIEPIPNLPSNP